jgi:hypothetical protein
MEGIPRIPIKSNFLTEDKLIRKKKSKGHSLSIFQTMEIEEKPWKSKSIYKSLFLKENCQ